MKSILRYWYVAVALLAFLISCAKPVIVQGPPNIGEKPTPLRSTIGNIIFENRSERPVYPLTVSNWGEQRAEVQLRSGLKIKQDVYLAPGGTTPRWEAASGDNLYFVCDTPPCGFNLEFPRGTQVMSGRATERVSDLIFVNQRTEPLSPLFIAVVDEALEYSGSGGTLPSHSRLTVKDPNGNTRLNLEARDQLPIVFAVTLKTGETIELSCFGNHATGTCTFNAYLPDARSITSGELRGNVYRTIYSGAAQSQEVCIVAAANPGGGKRSYADITVRDPSGATVLVFSVDDKATMCECVTLGPNMRVDMDCGIDDDSVCTYDIFRVP